LPAPTPLTQLQAHRP